MNQNDRDMTLSPQTTLLYCLHWRGWCSRINGIGERISYVYITMDGCIKLLIIIILLGVIASMF